MPPVSKDRIKAKDLDGKKGEVLEGWFKRILEEDPQTEARGPGAVLAVLLNLNLKIFEAGSAQPEANKHEVTAKRHGLALYISVLHSVRKLWQPCPALRAMRCVCCLCSSDPATP